MIFYEQQQTVQVTFSTQDFVKVQVNYKTEAHEQTEHNDKSGKTGTTLTYIFRVQTGAIDSRAVCESLKT